MKWNKKIKKKCVRDFSTEKQKELLFFATGSSQVPVTGFKDLQGSGKIQHFKLKRYGTENDLPVSHTWYVLNNIYIYI